jgi:DNA-binding transcriptional LysR family regulator
MDIRRVDLNLLPVLDALLRHRSVTRAAVELDMSQSALSAALGRLRSLLGDPLFVRTGRGLLPTARAQALAVPLAAILAQVGEQVMQAGAFDPAHDRRHLRIALSDVGTYVLWPRLLTAFRESTRSATLALARVEGDTLAAALLDGRVDLALGAYPKLAGALMQRRLFDRRFVGLVRAGHRLARRAPSVREFCAVPQVVVAGASGVQDRIDRMLRAQGLARTDTVESPSYLALPPLLEASDFLAVVPGQLAEAFAGRGDFAVVELPLRLPASTIRMHWHRRFHGDAANAWLRRLVVGVLTER